MKKLLLSSLLILSLTHIINASDGGTISFSSSGIVSSKEICPGYNNVSIYNITEASCIYGWYYDWEYWTDATGWLNTMGSYSYLNFQYTISQGNIVKIRRVLRGTLCNTAYSNELTLTTYPALSAGSVSSNQYICHGTQPSVLSVNAPSGGNGSYTNQWQSSPDNTSWSDISGATSLLYTPSLSSNTYFRCKQIGCGSTVYTGTMYVSFSSALTPGTISANPSGALCNNTNTTLTSTSASGGMGGSYTYQWQSSLNNTTWTTIASATSLSYTTPNLTQQTYYRVQVNNSNCPTKYSSNYIAYTRTALVPGTIGNSQTICYNTTPAQLTGTAATGGTYMGPATYSYQWQSSTDNITFTDITGATSLNYTSGNLSQTTYFRRKDWVSSCAASYTNTITVTVNGLLTSGTISSNQSICHSNTPSQLSSTDPSGGTGSYTYQWISSTDNINFSAIVGATTNKLNPSAHTQTTYYKLVTTSGGCGSVTSNTVTITVNPQITPGTITNTNDVLCYNTVPAQLTSTAATGGTGSNYTYQWQIAYGVTSNSFSDITSGNGFNSLTYSPTASTGDFRKYRIRISNSSCQDVYSSYVSILTRSDMMQGTISSNQTICYNTTPAQLTGSEATGGSAYMNTPTYIYQWESSIDNSSFTDIVGASSKDYQPTALTKTTYFRRKDKISACATVKTTNTIVVTVYNNLTAGTASANQTICYSNTPSQIISTSPSGGTGTYTYQWQSSNDNITFADISGATTLSYTPSALTQSAYYKLITTSGSCGSVTSNTVNITVNPQITPGTITNTNGVLCYNTFPAQLTCTAPTGGTGSNYTYQWQVAVGAMSSSFSDITSGSGYTTLSYTPSASTGDYRKFRIKISNSSCPDNYTAASVIQTRSDVSAGVISSNQIICYNTTPAQLTGTAATGGSYYMTTPTYSYQWQSSTDNITFSDISGAVSLNYSPSVLTQTTYFRRKDKVASCEEKITNTITVTVNGVLTSGSISSNQTICYSNTPAQLTSTAATGGTGSYSYQWQSSTDNSTFTDIAGAVLSSFNPPSLTATSHYRLKTTSGSCGSVYSNSVTITVNGGVNAGGVSNFQTICYNSIPNELDASIATGGMGGTYSYQWQVSEDNINYADIASENGLTYQPQELTTSKYYRTKVVNSTCPVAYSVYTKITVKTDVTPGTISNSQYICHNSQPDTIRGTSPFGGTFSTTPATYKYQWQKSINGTTWDDITINGTDINYIPGNLTQTTYFRRKDKEVDCDWKYTNEVTIVVYDILTSGTISTNQTVCYGSIPTVITGTSPTGGNGIYTYQWAYSLNNVNWYYLDSVKTQNYQPGALTAKLYLKRHVNSFNCGMIESNIVTINVTPQIHAGTIGADQAKPYNSIPTLLTGTNASGGDNTFTYQWQSSLNDTIYADIPSATGVSYQPSALTKTTYYKRLAYSAGCGPISSNVVTVTIWDALYGGKIGSSQNSCYNVPVTALTQITAPVGGDGTYYYQWFQSYDKQTWNELNGANSVGYTPGSYTKNVYFKRMVVAINSNDTAYSNIVQIIVSEPVNGGVVGYSDTLCNNGYMDDIININLASGGKGTKTYQWESSLDKASWVPINGAISTNYINGNINATTIYYRRKVTDQYCGTAYSNTVTITVLPPLSNPALETTDQTICYNSTPVELVGYAPTGGTGTYVHQWQQSIDSAKWYNISNANALNYQPNALRQSTWFRRRSEVAVFLCDFQYTESVKINVLANVNPGTIWGKQTICYNTAPTQISGDTATGGTGTYTYQWQSSTNGTTWNNIINASTLNYLPNVLTQTTYFRRKAISGTCESDWSNTITVTVMNILTAGTIGNNDTICYGTTPEPIFTVTNPSGANGKYSYQWQYSYNNSFWQGLTAADTNNYYYPQIPSQTIYFRKKITSVSCNNSVYTPSVKLSVYNPMTAGEILSNQTITSDKIASLLTGTDASGGDNIYSYQWQKSTNNTSWVNLITNANNLNYQPIQLSDTAWYRRIDNSGCGSDTTNTLVMNILTPLSAGTIGNDQYICSGVTPSKITETTAPTGGSGSYTYQWQKSSDAVTFSNILNATSKEYQPTALTVTTYYRRYTYNQTYDTAVSNIVIYSIYPTLVTGTIGSNSSLICYGVSPDPVAFTTQPSGGSNEYTYQWQSSPNGSVWSDMTNDTLEYYQPGKLTAKMFYRVKIGDGCSFVYSNAINIDVKPQTYPGVISSNQTIAFEKSPAPFVTTDAVSSDPFTYQWQSSTNNTNWINILNATNKNYQPGSLLDTTWFRRATIDACLTAFSNDVKITVIPEAFAGTISDNQSLCNNVRPDTLFGTSPSGGTGSFTYQWQKSVDSTSWSNILNATALHYRPEYLTSTTLFRRLDLIAGFDTVITNQVTVEIYSSLIAGTITSTIDTICYATQPSPLFTTIEPSGSDNKYTYQWEVSDWGYVWDTIPGATLEYYQPSILTTTKYFRKKVFSSCGFDYSNAIKIYVKPDLYGGVIDKEQTIGYGKTADLLHGEIPVTISKYTYQWQSSTDNASSWQNIIVSGTSQNYQPTSLNDTTWFRRLVINSCTADTSNTIIIHVTPEIINTITADQIVCYNSIPDTLTGHTPSGGTGSYTYQWQHSSDNGSNWINILNANQKDYLPGLISSAALFRRVVACGSLDTSYSNIAVINNYPDLIPASIHGNDTICFGTLADPILLNNNPQGGTGTYTYQWQMSLNQAQWNDIDTLGNYSYYIPGALTQTTWYRLVSIDGCSEKESDHVMILVRNPLNSGHAENDQFIARGSTPQLLIGSQPIGGNGNYTYQWQKSIDSLSWTNIILNATSKDYQPEQADTTIFFRRLTYDDCASDTTSNAVKITVLPLFAPGTISSNQTICFNTLADTITGTAASGGYDAYTYQWLKSTNGGSSWINIVGANNINLIPGMLSQSTSYMRKDKSPYCDTVSTNIITITVLAQVAKPLINYDSIFCKGETAHMAVQTPTLTYKWYDHLMQYSATGSTHQVTSIQSPMMFYVNATDANQCVSDYTTVNLNIDTVKANFTVSVGTIEEGNPVQFISTSVNASQVQWNFFDGDGSKFDTTWHYYNKVGVYNVKLKISSKNGCTDSLTREDVITVMPRNSLGLNSNVLQEIKVYPNPVINNLYIIMEKVENNVVVEIFSATGQLVSKQEFTNTADMAIDMSELPKAMYSLKITSESDVRFVKIVK